MDLPKRAYCNEQEVACLMPLAWNSSIYVLARSWSWRAHALTRLKATLPLGRSPCARMTSSTLQVLKQLNMGAQQKQAATGC